MILVDEPAGFAPGLVPGTAPAGPVPADAARAWDVLAGGRPARRVTGLAVPPFWHHGCLVARPAASQFDALRAATASAPPAAPVFALAGAGPGCRGQRDRPWAALPGNLHLTAVWPAPPALARLGPVLNALAAVAVVDAVAPLVPAAPCGIKWVNDVWLGGAKVAGVLTAARPREPQGDIFLGIGLNVVRAPDLPGDRFTPRATCLDAWSAAPCDPARVLTALLTALATRWEQLADAGPGPLVAAYRGVNLARGRRVTVWPQDGSRGDRPLAAGRVLDVTADLGLVLAGVAEPLRAGRLALDDA